MLYLPFSNDWRFNSFPLFVVWVTHSTLTSLQKEVRFLHGFLSLHQKWRTEREGSSHDSKKRNKKWKEEKLSSYASLLMVVFLVAKFMQHSSSCSSPTIFLKTWLTLILSHSCNLTLSSDSCSNYYFRFQPVLQPVLLTFFESVMHLSLQLVSRTAFLSILLRLLVFVLCSRNKIVTLLNIKKRVEVPVESLLCRMQ